MLRAQFLARNHGNTHNTNAYEQLKPSRQQKLHVFRNQPPNVNFKRPSLFNNVLQQTEKTVATIQNAVTEIVSVYTSCIKPAITAALIPPATGRVKTHARIMVRNNFQSTFLCDRVLPTNTTDPTLQWVVLIGKPRLDAANTVKAAPISMQNPLEHTKMSTFNISSHLSKTECHQVHLA
jgi:hypothetical protein